MNFEEAKVQITFSYCIYPHHVFYTNHNRRVNNLYAATVNA